MKIIKIISLLSFVLFVILVSNCNKQPLDYSEKVLINVMSNHPWDASWGRLAADNPNGFQGATPLLNTPSQGARSTFDNVRLGKGGYDMEVFVNGVINTNNGYLQIQLGITNYGSSGAQPFQEYHTTLPNSEASNLYSIINGSAAGWGLRKKSTYSIYRYSKTKWRTRIDNTDIIEYNVPDTNSYMTGITCGTGIFTTSTGNFPTVNFYPALETFNNGVWANVAHAVNTYGASRVGIEGLLINPLLRTDELNTGTRIVKPPYGIQLW